MRTPTKVAAFGGGLVVLFAAGLGVGALVGDPDEPSHDNAGSHNDMAGMDMGAPTGAGLMASAAGFSLEGLNAPTAVGSPGTLTFRISDSQRKPVTAYDELHEKDLHLIVVRSDTTEYRHVHPTLGTDGTWSIDWTWQQPGDYRVFADFDPAGSTKELVLSRTIDVAGQATARPLPAPARTADVDGYSVALAGDLTTAGGPLGFTVTKDGKPVEDLDPYLGAYGHLVALRASDLSYLHVHPQGSPGDGITAAGPEVSFHAQAPSDGNYRLFLDFKHQGTVHTAEFTAAATTSAAAGQHAGHDGGHP